MLKSIRFKLFLTLLLTTLFVVAGMFAFMRWSLDRGFAEFVEKRQREHLAVLLENLGDYYSTDPDWKHLAGNKRQWLGLLAQSHERRYPFPREWLQKTLSEPPDVWPPDLSDSKVERRFQPLELRVMLLRADQSIIFGRREGLDKLTLYPIRHQQQVVGYLGLLPGKPVKQPIELQFIERQTQSFIWIALGMVVLSAVLAWMLAYTLGRPLKRIAGAVKTLAVGNYDVRLPIESTDELGQLARDFNEMAAALAQAEQTRRRWIADISHELRTPIALLRGEIEALQDGIRPLTPSAVDSLYSDLMRLNRLTDDLYQLSLSDQGTLSYRKALIDPVAILKADMAALMPEFSNKQIMLQLIDQRDSPFTLYADADRMSQLFRNLLTNSLNYTDTGGKLEITVSRQGNILSIEWADSAPGVPRSALPHLFERFYRVESSRSRHHGGAGLGLAICSNIVKAHGGTIRASASALGGLHIQIELPVER
ncbi:ATP-binding protein [Methylomicrobium sp. Wu6]|uniref:ATP-binding protein n=1 Tax=Methylomicrobium sp. Wu6 TaxID=3107928 RepID=UPI002DD66244|nr:ATP-binding protein [Methylomicrobium sp. Wu6]MEC4748561.1 ATP-binding protein [Methylomicrobium sp. Wu6]